MAQLRATRAATRLMRKFLDSYPAEAAQALERTPASDIARLLGRQPLDRAAQVLEHLVPPVATEVIASMTDAELKPLLPRLDPGRAAVLLSALDEPVREAKLELVPAPVARDLRERMTYPPDSAGALMDPRIAVAFRAEQTVREVITRMRTLRRRRIYSIFLLDAEGVLTGVVPLQDVVLAAPGDRLGELARGAPITVEVTASGDAVVEIISRYNLPLLPVVDADGRMVGVIRQPALMAAAAEEATADIQKMVGVSAQERALSSPLFAVRKRLPWLLINLGTAFTAATVVGLFEHTIAKFTALAVLMPVVAGESGNTGGQSLAVTLRGLALREIRVRQWMRISFKEAVAGVLNGTVVALTTAAGVYVWSRSLGLCMVIGLAMITSMMVASLAGAAIPLVLTAARQDPAQSSTIILTTVTDITGFLSFLGLATLFSRML
jgi:magnesium transporter